MNYTLFSLLGEPSNDWMKDVEERIKFGLTVGFSRGLLQSNDPVVVMTGWKQGVGFTNTLRLVYVKDDKEKMGL